MTTIPSWRLTMVAATTVTIAGAAFAAQDRLTVRVPDGLAMSEFKGYEDWPVIAVSQTGETIEVIVGDAAMVQAYRTGIPGNGKPFPDGVRMAKIHWKTTSSKEAPAPTTVPGALHDVDFMIKDSKRFADSGNWGYAQFNYDMASDSFAPEGTGAACGYACHTIVSAKDYVFTAYSRR